MSAISLKSITGITSITTPAGVDNQLTLHNNNTTEAVKLDVAGNLHVNNQLAVTGVSTFSDSININDSKVIYVGTDNDLRISHDPSHTVSFIQNTGPLQIQTDDLRLYNYSTADLYLRAQTNAAVQLFYDYSNHTTAKLATTATGVTIDGTAVAGGLDISGDIDVDGHTNLDLSLIHI